MDITREIHDAENSLRDFLHLIYAARHGDQWQEEIPLAKKYAVLWEERRIPNEMDHNAIKGSENLIQYASLPELRKLLKETWSEDLEQLFDDRKVLDVYMRILEDYRDPDSRRRELFVHEKHLLLGIAGDIRNRIVSWRSRSEAGGIYSRIESVRDNLGNSWTPGSPRRVKTDHSLRVGDVMEFIITAADPEDANISYRCHHTKWQPNNVVRVKVEKGMVEKQSLFHIMVKSARKHHAYPMGFDDRVSFDYEVVPA